MSQEAVSKIRQMHAKHKGSQKERHFYPKENSAVRVFTRLQAWAATLSLMQHRMDSTSVTHPKVGPI